MAPFNTICIGTFQRVLRAGEVLFSVEPGIWLYTTKPLCVWLVPPVTELRRTYTFSHISEKPNGTFTAIPEPACSKEASFAYKKHALVADKAALCQSSPALQLAKAVYRVDDGAFLGNVIDFEVIQGAVTLHIGKNDEEGVKIIPYAVSLIESCEQESLIMNIPKGLEVAATHLK